jgi:p-aminobenzoyl-glutamate transporter AbgT
MRYSNSVLVTCFSFATLTTFLSSVLCIQVPVVDGYSYPHLTKRMNVAGRHITSYLVDLLSRRG